MLNNMTIKLYTGEFLSKDKEMELIKESISELQLEINISEIFLGAYRKKVEFLKNRLEELENS